MAAQSVWNIETAVRSKIIATGSITAIIGTNPVRVYPEVRFDAGAMPCIVYELNSTTPYQTLAESPTLSRSSVAIHCLAQDKKVAIDLAQKVQAAFATWSQTFYDGAVLKLNVQGSRVSSIITEYQQPTDGATFGLYLSSLDVTSFHT